LKERGKSDVATQPLDPLEWQKAVWERLQDLLTVTEIQSQEIETLRLRIKRLEAKVKELTPTQSLDPD
jgi:hypothetical protein